MARGSSRAILRLYRMAMRLAAGESEGEINYGLCRAYRMVTF